MTTENIALFKALGAKMGYLSQRQRVISQNVSNADTPGYQPQDLTPVDFSAVLKKINKGGNIHMEATNPKHMPAPDAINDPKARKQKHTYEVAPAGNAVIMEEQLMNANETVIDYNLMTSLYQKNVGMIRTAITGQ